MSGGFTESIIKQVIDQMNPESDEIVVRIQMAGKQFEIRMIKPTLEDDLIRYESIEIRNFIVLDAV
jgi:hypothetical protein